MYLVARTHKETGAQRDWLVSFWPKADLIEVTTVREKARRFKSKADAHAVRDKLERIEAFHNWRVVPV